MININTCIAFLILLATITVPVCLYILDYKQKAHQENNDKTEA